MDEQKDRAAMLELMLQSAFCVEQGTITALNQAARKLLIEPNTPVSTLLPPESGEYDTFQGGCLCLTLNIHGTPTEASVTRMEDCDIFVIETESDDIGLNTLAVASLGLREPLADIITIMDHQVAQLARQSDDPGISAHVAYMNQRLTQLHRMVCNMADAARFAHDTAPRMEHLDVCALLQELFDHADALAEHSGIRIAFSGPAEPVYSLVCPEQLERAVYNLISNAMRSAGSGGTIEATLSRHGGKLYLSVQDSGNGIPGDLLCSVYRRFLRTPGLESRGCGVGLGMALVRYAAASHGGTVLIDQPKGCGVRVTMTIAIRQSEDSHLRSNTLRVDYAGERDHGLLELSDVLPPELYTPQ